MSYLRIFICLIYVSACCHTHELFDVHIYMGWLRSVGSIKSQVTSAEYCLFIGLFGKRDLQFLVPTNQIHPISISMACTRIYLQKWISSAYVTVNICIYLFICIYIYVMYFAACRQHRLQRSFGVYLFTCIYIYM